MCYFNLQMVERTLNSGRSYKCTITLSELATSKINQIKGKRHSGSLLHSGHGKASDPSSNLWNQVKDKVEKSILELFMEYQKKLKLEFTGDEGLTTDAIKANLEKAKREYKDN
jgi:hypothetical protein